MEIDKMLSALREERDRINEAIISLERMTIGTKRRGRPPAWLSEVAKQVEAPRRRGRPPGSKNRKSTE